MADYERRRRHDNPRRHARERLHQLSIPGVRRIAADARAGTWLDNLRAASGVLSRVAENVRLAKTLRNRIPPHGAALYPPAQPQLARFTRNCGWVHARQRTRLFREQPPRHERAAQLCRGESAKTPRVWTALLGRKRQRWPRTGDEKHQ